MKCPVNGAPMIVVERHGIELDYCPICKGIWFDAGELRLLRQALNLDIEVPDFLALEAARSMEKQRPCPRCDKKLDKVYVGDVLIDRCPNGHGLWFDSGELGKLIEQQCGGASAGERQVVSFLGETFRRG